MNAICLITLQPNKIWCDFLNSFSKYKIFIIVDDNNFDCYPFEIYKNISFIKVLDEKCKLAGYMDSNFVIGKLISGWDKALYYFGVEIKIDLNLVWFIEDDVYFYNEQTIEDIDRQHKGADLLTNKYRTHTTANANEWHWNRIQIHYPLPFYSAMVCAARFSKNMICCVHSYAASHKTLFFLEALFPTLVLKNNLIYSTPKELETIYYRHEFQKQNITTNNMYHPEKNLNNHVQLRQHVDRYEKNCIFI